PPTNRLTCRATNTGFRTVPAHGPARWPGLDGAGRSKAVALPFVRVDRPLQHDARSGGRRVDCQPTAAPAPQPTCQGEHPGDLWETQEFGWRPRSARADH